MNARIEKMKITIDPDDYRIPAVTSKFPTQVLTVQYNPETFEYSRKINWKKSEENVALNEMQIKNVDLRTLTINLVFDAKEAGINNVKDLTKYFENLSRPVAKKANAQQGRPPYITITWATESVKGFINSFTQKFTLFSSEGLPLRARVTLDFMEYIDPKQQQKENSGGDPEQFIMVRNGETLQYIAYKEYGDPALWRIIADQNSLDDYRDLEPGTMLFIPALESILK